MRIADDSVYRNLLLDIQRIAETLADGSEPDIVRKEADSPFR